MAPNAFGVPAQFRSISGGRAQGVPAQYTTDRSVVPTEKVLNDLADMSRDKVRFAAFKARETYGYDAPEATLLTDMAERKSSVESEQARLRFLNWRWDNLYNPSTITEGGADHWPEGRKPGRNHVSLNVAPVYVEIPAALQAVEPDVNYVSVSEEKPDREKADRAEALYKKWLSEEGIDLKWNRACLVKGLYGWTFGKAYWNAIEKRPSVAILDSPENLYVGWGNSDFSRMDWAIYCYGLSKQAIEEDYGLDIKQEEIGPDKWMAYVTNSGDHADPLGNVFGSNVKNQNRQPPAYEMGQVEVYDYWYKKPVGKGKRAEVWNAIFVGNMLVENARHKELDDIPYKVLPNTFIPGQPFGKPELYDIEPLIREKEERLTNMGEAIRSVTDGQKWQLVGADAPDEVPTSAIPQPNKVISPGPGNEIKAIAPFVGEYAASDYIKELDANLEVESGLNELLLGRAPATILGSSKAIAALVANYESRISLKRKLLYRWWQEMWIVCAKIWESKDSAVARIIDGNYRLDIQPPELTPHDSLEAAQMAMSLVQNRIWSSERAMNATGVEDPTSEKNVIREEQTDPALNPAAVQAQVTLVTALQSVGVDPASLGIGQNQQANTARTLNPPQPGSASLNQPENQANSPNQPANAQAPNGAKAQAQSLLQGGEANGRIITNAPIG